MRHALPALLCAGLALAPAACTRQPTDAGTTAQTATFEMTPAVGVATGATVIVALGVTAVIACGIACF